MAGLFVRRVLRSGEWIHEQSVPRPDLADASQHHKHADGNVNDPLVQFEYSEIKETLRLEFLAKKTSSYLDFFRTRGNRYRLILVISLGVFSQWSGNALFSYYSKLVYEAAGVDNERAGLGLNGGNAVLASYSSAL